MINNFSAADFNLFVELNDIITAKNYTLYILVKAKGGNEIHVGPYEIHIGCHDGIPLINEGNMEYNKTFPMRTDRDKIRLDFDLNGLRSKNSYCSISNYEMIYSDTEPNLLNLRRPFEQPKDVYLF